MNIEDKKTSFVTPRFGVRGMKGLSKGTDKIFRSESMKRLNRIKNGDLGNPIVRTELMKVMESVATDIWHTKLGMGIKGDVVNVALDLLGGGITGLTQILSSYKKNEQSFVNREAINSEGFFYEIHIGENPQGKFAKVPFNHTKRSVILTDTSRDIENRLNLLSRGGINEKVVDIFDRQTFCTLNDLTELTKVNKHIDSAILRKQGGRVKDKKSNKLNDGLLKEYENSIKKERLYSSVLGYKTVLYINNDMTCYQTYVKVHICTHTNFASCDDTGAWNATQLANGLLTTYNLEDSYTKRYLRENEVFREEILKNGKKINPFKYSLLFRESTNIKNTETFRKKIKILKTITVSLKPSDYLKIKLHQHIPNGIDLFDLYNCKKSDASAHTFFIVEAIGSNARITERENRNIKRNGTSPIKLRYELKNEITFVSSETDPDSPIIYKNEEKVNQFDDYTLWEEFYQSRGEEFHLSYAEIDIDNNSPSAKYILDIDSKTMIPGSLLLDLQKETKKRGIEMDLDDLRLLRESESENKNEKEEEELNSSSDDYFSNIKNMDNDNDE